MRLKKPRPLSIVSTEVIIGHLEHHWKWRILTAFRIKLVNLSSPRKQTLAEIMRQLLFHIVKTRRKNLRREKQRNGLWILTTISSLQLFTSTWMEIHPLGETEVVFIYYYFNLQSWEDLRFPEQSRGVVGDVAVTCVASGESLNSLNSTEFITPDFLDQEGCLGDGEGLRMPCILQMETGADGLGRIQIFCNIRTKFYFYFSSLY